MMKYVLAGYESERIRFAPTGPQYTEHWLQFMSNPITQMHWFEPEESPQVKVEKWFEKQSARYANDLGGMNALIEKSSGRFLGHAGLLVQTVDEQQELEIGYSLMPEAWGQGFATEAARFCRDHAFHNDFSESLISIIAISNDPSKKVARRNGMKESRTTVYNKNPVEIFRITREDWLEITG